MARSRNIKPGLFKNELLGEADPICALLFVGLWCLADRDGRLEDRPKRIKAELFPYRDLPDFNGYLTVLEQLGFIDRYQIGEVAVIQVMNFDKHQSPHKTEKPSELPKKLEESTSCEITEAAPLNNESLTDVAALIPDSLIPDSGLSDSGGSGGDAPGADAPPPEKPKQTRFVPPTVDQVREYCQERGNSIDPQKFVDHYTANGWMRGKTKIKDWKACVRTWEGNQRASPDTRQAAKQSVTFNDLDWGHFDDNPFDQPETNGQRPAGDQLAIRPAEGDFPRLVHVSERSRHGSGHA